MREWLVAGESLIRLFREAQRRRVLRVAGLYIVGAFVVLQVADLALPALDLPDTAIRYIWFAMLLGFPVALVVGWLYDINDGKIVRVYATDESADISLGFLDYSILVASIIAALAIVLTAGTRIASESGTDTSSAKIPIELNSVAVLPFDNHSPDPDLAYLADGFSEQLLHELASISGLRVSARTSSFALRDKQLDIPTIGHMLRVANVVEGSIRVVDDMMRVTAQLIDSKSGYHLWSASYDRPLAEILDVQTEISRSIARAIPGIISDSHVPKRTRHTSAYLAFVRGRRALDAPYDFRSRSTIDRAISHFETSASIDPEFGQAYVGLAHAYLNLSEWLGGGQHNIAGRDEARQNAQSALQRAKDLLPDESETWFLMSRIADAPDSIEYAREAVRLNPNNADAIAYLVGVEASKGRLRAALDYADRAFELDPLNGRVLDANAHLRLALGELEEASQFFRLDSEIRDYRAAYDDTYLSSLGDLPTNLDFEAGLESWQFDQRCGHTFSIVATDGGREDSDSSAKLSSKTQKQDWCNAGQAFSARNFAGKFIRMTGHMKSEELDGTGLFWVRIDYKYGSLGLANGTFTDKRLTNDQDWTEMTHSLYVPHDADIIWIGVVLRGRGSIWIDDLTLEVFETANQLAAASPQ